MQTCMSCTIRSEQSITNALTLKFPGNCFEGCRHVYHGGQAIFPVFSIFFFVLGSHDDMMGMYYYNGSGIIW